jgi:Flp pilus assembly protein TadG
MIAKVWRVLRAIWPSSRIGQAVVEMAFVAPLLVTTVLGTVEVGSALRSSAAIANAAREGARLAGRGNIFRASQVLLVVNENCPSLDIAHHGTVIVTSVRSTGAGFTSFSQQWLVGSDASRVNQATLATLHQQATTSDPAYLRVEQFVIVEVWYHHETLTGLVVDEIPMYSFTVMPVSAPS